MLTAALLADETFPKTITCPNSDLRLSYCYWVNTQCSDLDLSNYWLNVTISDYKFSIPFSNLVQQVTPSGTTRIDCDLFIVQNYNNASDDDPNVLEIGDPFFSAFLPVFDVENELLGLALASRAVEGSSIELVVTDPDEDDDTVPAMA